MTIAANKVASIQYTVMDEQGQIIDTSDGGEPLVFLIGAQNVIQGLEEALIGKTVEPGMAFTAETEQGPMNLIVTAVEDNMVTVDGNHPLAGKALTFDVTVEAVRDATDEEIAHGHVHGEGGHQH